MNFINPYEVLEIETPDNSEIKKAKRRKLTEFDLSDDGSIEFKKLKIYKADFLKATDELDNEQKSQFYWSIKNNSELSNFLNSGDTWFFIDYQTQRVFNNLDFIEFVSPYFAYQYNNVIFQIFNDDNISLLKKLVENPILVSSDHIDKAYQKLREFINNQIQDLHKLRTDIENGDTRYEKDNVEYIFFDLLGIININIYNVLPTYFQSQQNEIAQKLRNISVAVFNEFDNSQVSLQIIKYALQLNINNLTKQNLEKDYNQIVEIHSERKEAEQYTPLLLKYTIAINKLQEIIQEVENNSNTNTLISKVNSIVDIDDLNKLPKLFDEIRQQIALSIRALSVEIFNEHTDIETANSLIKIALKINVSDSETKQRIREAARDLHEIVQKGIARQREELNQIITIFSDMYSRIRNTHSDNINQEQIVQIFIDIFTRDIIDLVANAKHHSDLQEQIFEHCKNVATKLKKKHSLTIIDRIKDIGKQNQNLSNRITRFRIEQENRSSGFWDSIFGD